MDQQQPQPDAPKSPEDLEVAFGPAVDIEDQLLHSADLDGAVDPFDEPVEPLPSSEPYRRGSNPPYVKVLVFLVALLLAVQAIDLVLRNLQPDTAPVVVSPQPEPPPATTSIDAELSQSRESLDKGFYEDVVKILAPYSMTQNTLDPTEEFELHLLLAKAYGRLGHLDQSTYHTLRATDQAIARNNTPAMFRRATQLQEQGRHKEARKAFYQILAKGRGPDDPSGAFTALSSIRVADTYLAEAKGHSGFEQLPSSSIDWGRPGQ